MRRLPAMLGVRSSPLVLFLLFCWLGQAESLAAPKRRDFQILILDEATGQPSAARLRATDAYNRYIPPLGHPQRVEETSRGADLLLRDGRAFAYVDGKCHINLPYGTVHILAMKGPEYLRAEESLTIDDETPAVLEIKLHRWTNLNKDGWYSGDSHVHFPPDMQNVHLQMRAEGLNVANVLLMKQGDKTGAHFWNTEDFTGGSYAGSTRDHLIYVNEEFRNHFLAHLVLYNLKEIVWPVSTGGLPENEADGDQYPTMADVADETHRQGGIVSWAHFDYPSGELPVDVALGKIDAADLLTVGNPLRRDPVHASAYDMVHLRIHQLPPAEVYYTLLNSGFRLPLSAGSDKMGNYVPIGSARVYVKLAGPFTYDNWVKGIKAGRTFITTGPVIFLDVNGKGPGQTIHVSAAEVQTGAYTVHVNAHAAAAKPYRFERLQLIVNGKVVREVSASKEGTEASLQADLNLRRSAWISTRCYSDRLLPYGDPTVAFWPQPVLAHSSPVFVDLPGNKVCDPDAVTLLLEQVRYLKDWIEQKAQYSDAEQKKSALAQAVAGEQIYEKLLQGQCVRADPVSGQK